MQRREERSGSRSSRISKRWKQQVESEEEGEEMIMTSCAMARCFTQLAVVAAAIGWQCWSSD